MCFKKRPVVVPPVIEPITPEPVFSGETDINELSSILIDKFPDVPIYLSDMSYKTCTVGELQRFLAWDKTDELEFGGDAFDCDDFAIRLAGATTIKGWSALPFGIVWTNLHALNCFVDNTGAFWFIEPQSDKIQSELEAWQGNEIRFIII